LRPATRIASPGGRNELRPYIHFSIPPLFC
jgi:hypothetical protein